MAGPCAGHPDKEKLNAFQVEITGTRLVMT
jgi:hypothetical protein